MPSVDLRSPPGSKRFGITISLPSLPPIPTPSSIHASYLNLLDIWASSPSIFIPTPTEHLWEYIWEKKMYGKARREKDTIEIRFYRDLMHAQSNEKELWNYYTPPTPQGGLNIGEIAEQFAFEKLRVIHPVWREEFVPYNEGRLSPLALKVLRKEEEKYLIVDVIEPTPSPLTTFKRHTRLLTIITITIIMAIIKLIVTGGITPNDTRVQLPPRFWKMYLPVQKVAKVVNEWLTFAGALFLICVCAPVCGFLFFVGLSVFYWLSWAWQDDKTRLYLCVILAAWAMLAEAAALGFV